MNQSIAPAIGNESTHPPIPWPNSITRQKMKRSPAFKPLVDFPFGLIFFGFSSDTLWPFLVFGFGFRIGFCFCSCLFNLLFLCCLGSSVSKVLLLLFQLPILLVLFCFSTFSSIQCSSADFRGAATSGFEAWAGGCAC